MSSIIPTPGHIHRAFSPTEPDVTEPNAFPDAGSVSTWAAETMCWAMNTGIILGDDASRLNPHRYAARAQAATILMWFCEYRDK